jgi:16S rRNA (adenine1518-N6/adenine1519-N6)-dimethyltransferase
MSKLELPLANKSLGQHFLKDQGVISRICSDFKGQAEAIVEIGPGPGILTESLAIRAKEEGIPFYVIEKDDRFPEYLRQFITEEQITMTDALAVHLSEWFKEKGIAGKKIWLVSNLPYNISTPLLINFLQATEIKFMTLMFQKEVADKVFPFSTTKNFMGSLHALTQSYFDSALLIKVPPGAFVPAPKVDSAVLTLSRKDTPLVPMEEFHKLEKFLRLLFSQRRKQLGGMLKASFPLELIQKSFESINVPLTIRAEALTLDHVLNLYRMLKK